MKTIAVFDFLSHEHMHLPFNEGHLKVLLAAFPESNIEFYAVKGHAENLSQAFKSNKRVTFQAIIPFHVAKGKSRHNPFYGRPAAKACLNQVAKAIKGKDILLATLQGAEANLQAVFAKQWHKVSSAPLHYILHNYLGAAVDWRTRNPFLKAFDYLSVLNKGLPENQKLIALELGIADAVVKLIPALKNSVETLEHPILESEWGEIKEGNHDGPIKIGFTGHCGPGKGFDYFVELANKFSGENFEFHGIGLANKALKNLDVSALKRKPSPTSVPRDEFVFALSEMDVVCLPFASDPSFVASGSIIDAITAGKPLFLIKNQSNLAIQKKYGEYGILFNDRSEISNYFQNFDRAKFENDSNQWLTNIINIRKARTAIHQAPLYKQLVIE